MQDKTSNHAPIPTELNIAPRGKSWLHGQLIDGEQGHPTRQSMESADRAQAIEAAPAQTAPAAVAVPEGAMSLLEALESMVEVCEGHDFDGAPSDAHMEKARAAISAYRAALAATPAAATQVVTDAQIKAVFLANGFTIKEGLTDLKPYVYQAARALLAGVSAPAAVAVAVPDGWREKFAADVYADLAAADNQDVPLEEYPARILKVLDSIVGPRHPVVIKWRNDAIRNCIAIAYKYCRDPESHKYLKQDLEAMLTTEPAPQAQAVERGEVLVTVSGFTGSGKSAIAGEIEIMCRALGLQVEWPDSDSEKHMTHADWIAALEQYKPHVRIVECNVPHSVVKGQDK